ncbi:MAG: hypothetical protein JST68_00420 [Bacteroidetes bacterium]|nr:hypothetical protein [Bacteroidota bacterium]
MKNILMPTDLTLTSLYPIHEICRNHANTPCNIYLLHSLHMPTGIADLLFHQQRKPYNQLTPAFTEGIEMLRKKYASNLRLLSFEFCWSNTRSYLQHYMESREINSIYMLEDHPYKERLPQSTPLLPALHKCKVPITYVEKPTSIEFGTLTTLLYKERVPA